MLRRFAFVVIAFASTGLCPTSAQAPAPEPSDTAKEMVGAWEISNAPRDKTCPLTFRLDPAAGGYKLELDEACGTAFPSLKDVTSWAMGPNDAVRLFDSKGAIVLDFMETTVAATARAMARTPISTRAMPKTRNQPQL